jgi:hypothetical protein
LITLVDILNHSYKIATVARPLLNKERQIMTHYQFKQYIEQVGVTFAARLALQEGVCTAQVHLWVMQARPKTHQDLIANLKTN